MSTTCSKANGNGLFYDIVGVVSPCLLIYLILFVVYCNSFVIVSTMEGDMK